jgi:hypothetical protein
VFLIVLNKDNKKSNTKVKKSTKKIIPYIYGRLQVLFLNVVYTLIYIQQKSKVFFCLFYLLISLFLLSLLLIKTRNLMKNTITIHDFEQRTPEWEAIRVGKAGGSEIIGITTPARMKTFLYVKATEVLTGKQDYSDFMSDDMQRGVDLEPVAIAEYEARNFVEIRKPGYVTNGEMKYAGISPDGLIGETGHLEVKAPRAKKHVEIIVTGKLLKEYEAQVFWAFVLMPNVQFVDFVSYCPELEIRPYHQITLKREDFETEIASLANDYKVFEQKMDELIELVKTIK